MKVLGEGRFLRLVDRHGWELVDRPGVEAIVAIVAVNDAGELLLVEQYREPVRGRVVELPAGLVGDEPGSEGEPLATAARRELEEETGYTADEIEVLTAGPPSAGLSTEVVTLVRARGVRRVGDGGGVGEESITLHRVPLADVPEWLAAREAEGLRVDPKVWAGLWFASRG